MSQQQHPYEEPMLLGLLFIALFALIWLFNQFIPALLFALLVAISSYPWYQKLCHQYRLSETGGASLLTLFIFLGVILPFSYLLWEGSRMGSILISQVQHWLESQPPGSLKQIELNIINNLPLPSDIQENLIGLLDQQLPNLIQQAKSASLWLAGNLLTGLVGLIGFISISLFSLFFFYRDGAKFVQRLVHLSPLSNPLDYFIARRFASLASILTLSVIGIALLQGTAFAMLMLILDMPWLFLGLAFAISSFIPIVGGMLIWLPVSLYFIAFNQPDQAIITAVYSMLIIGVGIDNLLRPLFIQKLNQLHSAQSGKTALDHTWITLLSTFAGLLHFGIMGLIFGPMLAAMAITIFDVYEHKHRHQLDYS